MVQFGRFKRLEPLKKVCPITWNGYLGDKTVRNDRFCTQTSLKTIAMATHTLNSNLTCIPNHLVWVSVWSVPYPERRCESNRGENGLLHRDSIMTPIQ